MCLSAAPDAASLNLCLSNGKNSGTGSDMGLELGSGIEKDMCMSIGMKFWHGLRHRCEHWHGH